jgi:hypothetical protein
MTDALRFLFIPVSGPGGAGEYFRSLAVARAIERRWPGSSIRFLVSRDATYSQGGPYPTVLLERSPTFETAAVIRCLEQERPHVVVFDSAGRVEQQQAARRLGARVVFVSSRPSIRRKGFRLRRMRTTDQHWIAQPRFLGGELTAFERWKRKFAPQLDVLLLEVVHEPVDEEGTRGLQQSLGVRPGGYVLACPGGGGVSGTGPDAAQVYFDAAVRVNASAGVPVVAVLGSRFAAPEKVPDGVHVLSGLPNGQLMGLLRDAQVGMVNGGSLLLQALAQHTPCVAAPIADDQPLRIAQTTQCGYVRPVALETEALASATIALLRDAAALAALRARLAQLGLRNGLEVAIEGIGRLLPPELARRGTALKAS